MLAVYKKTKCTTLLMQIFMVIGESLWLSCCMQWFIVMVAIDGSLFIVMVARDGSLRRSYQMVHHSLRWVYMMVHRSLWWLHGMVHCEDHIRWFLIHCDGCIWWFIAHCDGCMGWFMIQIVAALTSVLHLGISCHYPLWSLWSGCDSRFSWVACVTWWCMYVQYDSDTDILATALIFDMCNHV